MILCPCGHNRYGYFIKDQKLCKNADGPLHMLAEPRGWAVQASVFDYHKDEILAIGIDDTRSGIHYEITKDAFQRVCFSVDRGFGIQLVVALKYWHLSSATTKQLQLL